MNIAAITGRLGRDVEIKTTQSGKKVTRFTVAVRGYSKDETLWVDCEAWNGTAEYIEKYVAKGDNVIIDGSLKQESWQGNDGKKRTRLVVLVSHISCIPKARLADEESAQEDLRNAVITDEMLPF